MSTNSVTAASDSNWFSRRLDDVKSLGEKTGVTDLGKSIYETGKDVVVNGANIATLDAADLDNNGSSFDIFGAVGNTVGDGIKGTWDTGASVFGIGERATSGVLTGKSQSYIADTLKGDDTAGIMGYFSSSTKSASPNAQDATNQSFRNQVNATLAGVNGAGYTGNAGNTGAAANNQDQSSGGIIGALGQIFSGLSNVFFGGGQTQAAGQTRTNGAANTSSDLSEALLRAANQYDWSRLDNALSGAGSSSSMPTAGNPTTETEAQKQVDDINTALAKESAAVKAEEGQVESSKVASENAVKAEGTAKTDMEKADKDLSNHLATEPKKDDPKYNPKDGNGKTTFDQAAYDADMKVFNETKTKLEGLVKEAKTNYEKAQVKTKDTKAVYEQNQKELKTAQDKVTRLDAELKIANQNLEKFKTTENKDSKTGAPSTPTTPGAAGGNGSGENLIQLKDIPANVRQYLTEAKGEGYTPAEVAEAKQKAETAQLQASSGGSTPAASENIDDTDAIQEAAQPQVSGDGSTPVATENIQEDDTAAIQDAANSQQQAAANNDNNGSEIGGDDTDAIQEAANAQAAQPPARPLQGSKTYELNGRKAQLENEVKAFEELANARGAKNYKNTEKYQALQNELGQINDELGTRTAEIQSKQALDGKNSEIKAANKAIDEQLKPLTTKKEQLQKQQKGILHFMQMTMAENKNNGLDPRDSARYRELQGEYDNVTSQLGQVLTSMNKLESKKQPLES